MKNFYKQLKKVKMPQLWKNFFPKKTTKEMDEQRLMSLMENFTGQKFQWVKTDDPKQLGKMVKCRTIEPRGDRFLVLFDDGSSIDSALLNKNLFMIHGDMEPLSLSEIEAINGPIKPVEPKPAPPTPPQERRIQEGVVPQAPPVFAGTPQPVSNMFDMFGSEETTVSIALSVKLPDKKLLKLMYQNAENKDKFLDELSDYMQRMINKQVIKDSVLSIVDGQKSPRK
jgi:hypothetical protein